MLKYSNHFYSNYLFLEEKDDKPSSSEDLKKENMAP